jgi:hypothetical protein
LADAADPEWSWLANDAIEDFENWRIQAGATSASASSYATGARSFVRYCRAVDVAPTEAIESFPDYLKRSSDLSDGARSDYRSHARAFVQFLQARSHSFDITPTADLLAGYARTLNVLRSRGVIRTANAPVGDFAEWLVWKAFGGRIEPNSTKSHDVTDAVGRKLQVKARLISPNPTAGQLQTSVFRSWDFDLAILVLLGERDYVVMQAAMLPVHVFEKGHANARWSTHVKGWSVFMTPALMRHPDAIDVTAQLRAAAQAS